MTGADIRDYLSGGAQFSLLGWGLVAFLVLLYSPDFTSWWDPIRMVLYLLPAPALTFLGGMRMVYEIRQNQKSQPEE